MDNLWDKKTFIEYAKEQNLPCGPNYMIDLTNRNIREFNLFANSWDCFTIDYKHGDDMYEQKHKKAMAREHTIFFAPDSCKE